VAPKNWRCGTEGRGPEKGPARVWSQVGGGERWDRTPLGVGGVGRAGSRPGRSSAAKEAGARGGSRGGLGGVPMRVSQRGGRACAPPCKSNDEAEWEMERQ
jgi:hypothetical protein